MTEDWTAPGAWEVAPDIYRIPLPMPTHGLRAINVYAIRGSKGFTLIDTGWAFPEGMARLEAGLRSLGGSLDSVEQCFITHSHSDHYSLAVELRELNGTAFAVGEHEEESIRAVIADWDAGFTVAQRKALRYGAPEIAEAFLRWHAANPEQSRLADEHYDLPDRWLRDGEIIEAGDYSLRVHATPGHTVGHVVFADTAAGVLFTGDHVLPRITPSVSLEPVEAELPLLHFMASLDAMLRLPDLTMLPAHGPAGGSVHERVQVLLDYHEDRLTNARLAVLDGATRVIEVARRLSWTRRDRSFDELDEFNRLLAFNETLAHLELLVHRGALTETESEGVPVWTTY